MYFQKFRRAIAATILVSAVACATSALAANPTPPKAAPAAAPGKGNAVYGKVIFTKKVCAQCHKPDGSGGVKLTGNPSPSWKDKKRMATVTDAFLRDCITNGKIKSGMVAWGKSGQIKPAEIEDLIAYIRTFAK